MKKHILIRKNSYFDSVELMRISGILRKDEGVEDAQLIMGSDANKQFLIDMGLNEQDFSDATSLDLIIYFELVDSLSTEVILEKFDEILSLKDSGISDEYSPRSIEGALKIYSDINFILISLPGEHASWEAKNALREGKNVMIFSDNVTISEEIEIKKLALEKGLMVMGPDCGTSIINEIPLGFANKVRKGKIGLISASGTGLQAVTCEIHNLGEGISQAIGIGGRDLSSEVGGITMKTAITALINDPETEVIVLISKPPAPEVAEDIMNMLKESEMPFVLYFIHSNLKSDNNNVFIAKNLSHTAGLAVELLKGNRDKKDLETFNLQFEEFDIPELKTGKFIRGLYTGGTLADEAIVNLEKSGNKVYSNIHYKPEYKLENPLNSKDNTIIDLGDDFFTRGRPHPMIDPESRIEKLEQELTDPETGVILLDIVLGSGSHEDMAGALLPVLKKEKGEKIILAYVLGTDLDFQDKNMQVSKLRDVGVHIFESHIAMIYFANEILKGKK